MTETIPISLKNLYEEINNHFDDNELQTLCFKLQIKYDGLAGNTLPDKVRSLILYTGHNHSLRQLLIELEEARPGIFKASGFIPSDSVLINLYNQFPSFSDHLKADKWPRYLIVIGVLIIATFVLIYGIWLNNPLQNTTEIQGTHIDPDKDNQEVTQEVIIESTRIATLTSTVAPVSTNTPETTISPPPELSMDAIVETPKPPADLPPDIIYPTTTPECLIPRQSEQFFIIGNFHPSGIMGDVGDVTIQRKEGFDRFIYQTVGKGPHEWEYKFEDAQLSSNPAKFGGVMYLNEPNNWGIQPGVDLQDFRRSVKWEARSIEGEVDVQFVIGGVIWMWNLQNGERTSVPYPDSMRRTELGGIRTLSDDWREFTYEFSKSEEEFNCVIGGFSWVINWGSNDVFINEEGTGASEIKYFTIEIRNIRYEGP